MLPCSDKTKAKIKKPGEWEGGGGGGAKSHRWRVDSKKKKKAFLRDGNQTKFQHEVNPAGDSARQ